MASSISSMCASLLLVFLVLQPLAATTVGELLSPVFGISLSLFLFFLSFCAMNFNISWVKYVFFNGVLLFFHFLWWAFFFFWLILMLLFLVMIDDVCKDVECGKGMCKASSNSAFFFECECQPGWKQTSSGHTDHLKFLPCVIPNCNTFSLHLSQIQHFQILIPRSVHDSIFKFY